MPEKAADAGLIATARSARPSFVPRKSACIRPMITTMTTIVPSERTLMTAPPIRIVSSGNSDGKSRLLYVQIQAHSPVMSVSRPIVTTTAVSGSPRSNRRMRYRSMSAPRKNETTIAARIARMSGTPNPLSDHAM
jgi:hypothetical protein